MTSARARAPSTPIKGEIDETFRGIRSLEGGHKIRENIVTHSALEEGIFEVL
jgi:hypothetical protein